MVFGEKIGGILIALCCCLIIAFTLNQYGITWDEGSYILAGESYARWVEKPSQSSIDKYWKVNHEHPPFYKLLGGISSYLFFERLKILDRATAFRIPVLLFVFALNYSLFCFSAELYNGIIAITNVAFFFFYQEYFSIPTWLPWIIH